MTHPQNDPWNPLRLHLAKHAELSQLSPHARENLLGWMESAGPFQDQNDLRSQLAKAKIKGVNKQRRQCFADSLSFRITRRPFMATLGLASAASLYAGVRHLLQEDADKIETSALPIRPLLSAIQQQQATVGVAVVELMTSESAKRMDLKSANWQGFVHALDMSNWLDAAMFLRDTGFSAELREKSSGTPIAILAEALTRLLIAWTFLSSTRRAWEDEYFIAYALGKMPALAAADASTSIVPDDDAALQSHAAAIHAMASLFHALEVLNQRFQVTGRTRRGAPVRFTQGHNYSYGHFAEDLSNRDVFSKDQPIALVNWDAHADLSSPFENPRIPLDNAFDLLQGAGNFAQRVVVSSSMSIAGWILPLIYQGLLSAPNQVAKIVWVAPKEVHRTSRNYMEPYGDYSFVVGDWQLPGTEEGITELSTTATGEWNIPGSLEIRTCSDKKSLRSVAQPSLLNNQRECLLHIVDPANRAHLHSLVDGAQIALSVDADFAGTREPGLTPRRGYLPHYPLTGSGEKQARHEELMGQLAKFVDKHEEQIRSVSIANSPNFTVAEETRQPVAKILKIVTGNAGDKQPAWIQGELARVASHGAHSRSALVGGALATGGITGIVLTATLLLQEHRRLSELHSLLFSDGSTAD